MRKHKAEIIIISFLVISLLIGMLLVLLNLKGGKKAIVYHGSDLVLEIDLSKDEVYEVNGDISPVKIVVKDNELWVDSSGCDKKICINTGIISHENEFILCSPNKIFIKIVGAWLWIRH